MRLGDHGITVQMTMRLVDGLSERNVTLYRGTIAKALP